MTELTADDVIKARQEHLSKAFNPEAMAELETHAEALVRWLRKYHTPLTGIRIAWERYDLYEESVGVPVPYEGEA